MKTQPQPKRWLRWHSILNGKATTEIGRTPRELVYQRDLLKVYRYHRDTPATQGPPILLVYSLVNTPAVLDLLPGRSVVERLLASGYEVYLLDWGIPSALDYFAGLETYVDLYLRTVVRQVCKLAGVKQVNLLGYCMGGTLAAIYTSRHPRRVKTLTLLGTPLRFRSEKLLYRWSSDPNMCKPGPLVEAWAVAPPWSFDGYTLLTLDRKPEVLKSLYDQIDNEEFVESYKAMERWVKDNIPMAASLYREFLEACFLNDELLEGKMDIGGKTVDLSTIKCPVLIINGSTDHLVPPETTGSREGVFADQTVIEFPTGHIGLSVSSKSHRSLWPQVTEWMCNQTATTRN
ncbi:MAG: alpha/beta fold hydrolase [Vulcanimicrobiota bacterium]